MPGRSRRAATSTAFSGRRAALRSAELDVEVIYTPWGARKLFMPDYGTARADFPGGDAQSVSWHLPPERGCSCVTTIRLPPAHLRLETTVCARSARKTSRLRRASPKTN